VANSNVLTRWFKSAWNAFKDQEKGYPTYIREVGPGYSRPRHRSILTPVTEGSIISAIYNRGAIDVAMLSMKHVRTDENENYLETIKSTLNDCLTNEANIDQSGLAFIMDVVMSMFDEGAVAIVPVDTSVNMTTHGSFDILSLRTGKILEWFPQHVRLRVYNERSGEKEELILPKSRVGIVENPLYSVMNEPNSTLQRLIAKLNLLDAIDQQSGSGKLDLIIQLPYVVRSEARQQQAAERISNIEQQLKDSPYGIAYADGTEKIVQLNRPAENNLMGQIEYLTKMLYGQLGLSDKIFDGTASEEEFLNYNNRTVYPVAAAIVAEMRRKFLTRTARSQGQTIQFFKNPFGLVTAANLAEFADKFTRNEILTGNEFRSVLGFVPSKDPTANELRNKNLNVPAGTETKPTQTDVPSKDSTKIIEGETNQNGRQK